MRTRGILGELGFFRHVDERTAKRPYVAGALGAQVAQMQTIATGVRQLRRISS